MKTLRLILSIIVGMITITLVAEAIEFLTVKLSSGENLDVLTKNQEKYFSHRNTSGILIFKMIYSLLAGFIAGYITSLIAKVKHRTGIYILIALQAISLIYAGFISEMGTTGPLWMWIGLIISIPIGILLGNKLYSKKVK
ncbi:hypothetical protein [uncultured Psychroserpens sp.]|uniref:hypothetical protein n=1 Tax=uncultured Psychroserpens sp. TaxID=255436 RepID=UPI00262F6875|nr:hypothetical protein [uncultured Psychroserpens sp.]